MNEQENNESVRARDRQDVRDLIDAVTRWVNAPLPENTDVHLAELEALLSKASIVALTGATMILSIMTAGENLPAARILWCEVARRSGIFDFKMGITQTKSGPKLDLRAPSRGVSSVKLAEKS